MNGSPPPPNFQDAASQDTKANRPNQTTPWGTSTWTRDGNGNWSQSVGFTGALGGAAAGLQEQAAANLGTPMDWSQFGQMQDGSAAREQAINSAYTSATSRLDPQWQQRESAMRTQLANQGLDPNSEAGRAAMTQLGQQRNDAYSGAMSSAIQQGQAAGDSVFRNNMASRGQAIAEALQQRGQPLQDMRSLQGFLQMPGFAQGGGNLQAAQAQYGADMQRWQAQQQMWGDIFGGVAGIGGAYLMGR